MEKQKLPNIVLYNTVSVDGRLDWFPADVGLFYSLIGVWNEQATLCGSNTILTTGEHDQPETDDDFTSPTPDTNDTRPYLVICDSQGRVKNWHMLKRAKLWKGYISLCSKKTPQDHLEYLNTRNIDIIISGEDKVDLKSAIEVLCEKHMIERIRVDSGGTLNGILLRQNLVDEISTLINPSLVGGESSKTIYKASDLKATNDVISLKLLETKQIDGDHVWLRYEVKK
jgi:2,5-diamino-6-(ribosylamino)-4(3H)-pyrimidinone 5'-phosphate reductase